ncbi:MAG: exo-alpha-sialidase, partial [Anaerolineae bacterium]|nr:exo-alpha-sialidase [Anaerolineae bacterium]
YIVKTGDGAWLCCVTTGLGTEGQSGQHVVTVRSMDGGKTWEAPVDVEPAQGPEASYAVMLKVPEGYPLSGRVYIFYNHNTDNVREVMADVSEWTPDGLCRRVDSLGHFVFKYSDDGGQTWSTERFDIPQRSMEIDRQNPYGGSLKFFWNVGKPFSYDGAAYVSLHKVGGFGHGFFTRSEGVLLKSSNLFTEHDAAKVTWETLPEGDIGLRTPPGGGPIAEEQSYVVLSDGTFYSVYRTIDGHPTCAYSRDAGCTWTAPQYQCYADGRLMKHPRAANFAWKCTNGKYLYWFHNHGGQWYEDRNPVWLCGGLEADSPEGKVIRWSQPEIVLYDDDPFIRMSYPDLVEEKGKYYLTETQKDIARVHEIDTDLLHALWHQFENAVVAESELVLSLPEGTDGMPAAIAMPQLFPFCVRDNTRADHGTGHTRSGFSIALWLRFENLDAGQILLDNRMETGQGFCLQTTSHAKIELVLNDGRTENRWVCDPESLKPDQLQHVVVTVDGGPHIITYVIDGVLNDGGAFRQFGWGRFSPNLRGVEGSAKLRIAPQMTGSVKHLRIYNRALTTSEAIGNYRAGPEN